jgi:hypothetical protein
MKENDEIDGRLVRGWRWRRTRIWREKWIEPFGLFFFVAGQGVLEQLQLFVCDGKPIDDPTVAVGNSSINRIERNVNVQQSIVIDLPKTFDD